MNIYDESWWNPNPVLDLGIKRDDSFLKRNHIQIILEPRVPIGQVWLVQVNSPHEETRLPEEAGDRGGGSADAPRDSVGDGEG